VSDQAQPDKDEIAKPPQMLAIGLIDDAKAYVESGRQLDKCVGVSAHFFPLFPPIYFLLCQAMELSLKAYLAASGVSNITLRKRIGHDLGLAL
jgi:hypothetical protein